MKKIPYKDKEDEKALSLKDYFNSYIKENNTMFKSFDASLVVFDCFTKKPLVRADEDMYFRFFVLEENQKLKNQKQYYELVNQIQRDKDMYFYCDFDKQEVYLTKRELVKETDEGYELSYIVFDINSGEEIVKDNV
jgi:hypothetical protein